MDYSNSTKEELLKYLENSTNNWSRVLEYYLTRYDNSEAKYDSLVNKIEQIFKTCNEDPKLSLIFFNLVKFISNDCKE